MKTVYDYSITPLPAIKADFTTADYRNIPFDDNHERSNDPLVNIKDYDLAGQNYYYRHDLQNPPYYKQLEVGRNEILLRKTVAEKLQAVNSFLEPFRLEVFIMDGYRPIEVQQEIWDFFIKQAKMLISDATPEQLYDYAAQYASDPNYYDLDDPTSWPIHTTGGSVDLTLKVIDQPELLFMGSIFDDPTELSHTRHFDDIYNKAREDKVIVSPSILNATKNRRILYYAMTAQNFTNYHKEWWHFDLGTQMWALNKNIENGNQDNKAFYKTVTR